MTFADGLTIAGLGFDILGFLMLFRFAPQVFAPSPIEIVRLGDEPSDALKNSVQHWVLDLHMKQQVEENLRERYRQKEEKSKGEANHGAVLMVIGFALQALAVVCK